MITDSISNVLDKDLKSIASARHCWKRAGEGSEPS